MLITWKVSKHGVFFLVRIFLYSDWIRRFTELIPIFSPNTGKYGPEKTPYLDTFHAVFTKLICSQCFLSLTLRYLQRRLFLRLTNYVYFKNLNQFSAPARQWSSTFLLCCENCLHFHFLWVIQVKLHNREEKK